MSPPGNRKAWTVRDQAGFNARQRARFAAQRRAHGRRDAAARQEIERGAPGTCQRLVPGENGQRECGAPAEFEWVAGPRCLRFCEDCARHVPQKYALRPIKDY